MNKEKNNEELDIIKEFLSGYKKNIGNLSSIDDCLSFRDELGRTLLHYAADSGNLRICELLVNRGMNVDERDKEWKTPLMVAVINNHSEVVSFLVDKGADINAQDRSGKTPLHYCVLYSKPENKEIFKFLLEKGADINLKDNSGNKPLVYALSTCKPDMTKRLIERSLKGENGKRK